ncbi:MAG: polyphosphate--nucleotide phosphotransferase [Azospira oryzae]|jgi:PPK2 family polyphosphate:nucleotide phosphotransferase|nr:MAG: polyphosphate--nucleotide phosphotransferase [Azospira oryzae]
MKSERQRISIDHLQVNPAKKLRLRKFETQYTGKEITKQDSEKLLEQSRKELAEIQDMFYAANRYSVLIILQAMDAAGKDGAVKHIMSGFNPMGVKVYSFKAPTSHELDHDYFWRHALALPARGEIAIHNRSHYENVLVTRVHPEYLLNENVPGIDSLKQIDNDFWEERFKQIRRFEKNLTENGTVILKFFLHLSKKEQKKRLIDRIDDTSKNWKFSLADLKERDHWEEYQKAYEDAITATTTEEAPWFIIPADDKWYARVAIAQVIITTFRSLKIGYPSISEKHKADLHIAKAALLAEEGDEQTKPAKKKARKSR